MADPDVWIRAAIKPDDEKYYYKYDRDLGRDLFCEEKSPRNVLFYGQNNYFETPHTNIRSSIPHRTLFSSSDLGPYHIYSMILVLRFFLILPSFGREMVFILTHVGV